MLEGSTDPAFPNGLYAGTRDDVGGFYWTALAFKGADPVSIFLREWYQKLDVENNVILYPKKQFLDIENVNINAVPAGQPFAVRFVDPPDLPPGFPEALDPEYYQRLEFDVPEAGGSAVDRVQGGGIVLPAPGETKQYTLIVMADSGTMLPFSLPDGYYMVVDEVTGLWGIVLPNSIPSEEIISDADGVPIGGTPIGQLQYAIRTAGNWSGTWDYVSYDTPITAAVGERHVKFAQRRSDPVEYGFGYLAVKYTVAAPEPPPQFNATAQAQHNANIISCTHLGSNRWRVVATQINVAQDSYGSVSIACVENIAGTPGRCWTASNADFQLWQAWLEHNRVIGCGGSPTSFDLADAGQSWMEGQPAMERFDFRFIGTTGILEFDLTGIDN